MQPPMPDEEKYKIKLLLDTLVSGTITFCSPKSGNYRMACTEHDIDGDKSDEAVVFYQEKLNGVTQMYIHFFRKDANEWVSIDQAIKADGEDIYSFEIVDLNRDGTDEIIVLWENDDSHKSSKTLAVYEYDNESFSFDCVTTQCEDVTIVDLKYGGSYELVTISLETTETATVAKAAIYEYDKYGLIDIKDFVLDSGVIGYAGIVSSTIDDAENNNANASGEREYFSHVMIDCYYQSRNQLMTYVIYWPKDIFTKEYMDEPEMFDPDPSLVIRDNVITSRDVDNDGTIDVPTVMEFCKVFKNNGDTTTSSMEQIIAWRTYDTTLFTSVYMVVNTEFNYTVTIPEKWISDISIMRSSSKNEYIFYKWDAEGNQREGLYFKVRVFKASDWNKNVAIYTGNALDYNYEKVATNAAGTLVYALSVGDYGLPDEITFTLNE